MQGLSKFRLDWRNLVTRIPLVLLLATLLVALPVTAVGLYVAPYPEVPPLFLATMIVISLGMSLLIARWSLDPIHTRRLSGFLWVGTIFVLSGTSQVGAMVLRDEGWASLNVVVLDLATAFICLALFAFLLDRQNTRVFRAIISPLGIMSLIASFIVLVVLASFVLTDRARDAEEQAKHGPSASWPVQLSVAQSEAARRNSDAVLEGVTASTVYARNQDYNTALSTRFYFVTPAGERFKVILEDINPADTARAEPIDGLDPSSKRAKLTQDQLRQLPTLGETIATIRISPREALQKTVPHILPVIQQRGDRWTDPWIELRVAGWDTQAATTSGVQAVPAAWVVEHAVVAGVDRRSLLLNAATGELITQSSEVP
jgi:hypothetical protein